MQRITKQSVFTLFENVRGDLDLGIDSNANGITFTNRAGNVTYISRMTPREAHFWLNGVSLGQNLIARR